jgi:AcrR family transcriptional regulator
MAARSIRGGPARSVRKRPPYRREMIVSAAAELFRAQGYAGTRIEDIGAAVGMTGPALYRHFPSKKALLAELLERAQERALRDVQAALDARLPARATLERIVRSAVAHAVEENDLIVMADREEQDLPAAARRRIARDRRAIVEGWLRALRDVRPELDPERALAMVAGAAALITSSARRRELDPAVGRELYARMAMAALLAG